ncbi:hypothetical protein DPMN_017290 [Dreissena polymorpha]|uniref:Uncharacterized protein n=1 Tax=Dreissena polymorpha TaxID=45954 RepID=A0A9D4S690_DREPO|nr:hypothetical protein DPMN_017290 [Dreissena polymorpha]
MQLKTLSISVDIDIPGLLEALRGLNIKSLSLDVKYSCLTVDHEEPSLRSLSSLMQLKTLSISVDIDIPGLWEALRGLNIKSLSLDVKYSCLTVDHVEPSMHLYHRSHS